MEWQWGQVRGTVSYAFGIKIVMPKNVKFLTCITISLYIAFIQIETFLF